MRLPIATAALVALAFAVPAAAQQLDQKPLHQQRVTVEPVDTVVVVPGRPTKLALRFRVTPGFHINSSKPTSELLLPTQIKFNAPTDIVVGRTRYPRGELMSFPFAPNEKLDVYTGPFAINALVSSTRNATPGTYKVRSTLRYQACNDRACFPPKNLEVDFNVKIARRGRTSYRPRRSGQSPNAR